MASYPHLSTDKSLLSVNSTVAHHPKHLHPIPRPRCHVEVAQGGATATPFGHSHTSVQLSLKGLTRWAPRGIGPELRVGPGQVLILDQCVSINFLGDK